MLLRIVQLQESMEQRIVITVHKYIKVSFCFLIFKLFIQIGLSFKLQSNNKNTFFKSIKTESINNNNKKFDFFALLFLLFK